MFYLTMLSVTHTFGEPMWSLIRDRHLNKVRFRQRSDLISAMLSLWVLSDLCSCDLSSNQENQVFGLDCMRSPRGLTLK
jgi:hypothetical protein